MNKYINSLQSYILPSLTGRGSLLESVALHWGRVCFFLLSLLLFAACSSDNDEQVQQPQPEKSYPLTIEVTENPMTGDGENSSNRAAITTTSTFGSFKMHYAYEGGYSDDEELESGIVATNDGDGKWTTSGSWPSTVGDEDMVTWYAQSNGSFLYNSGNPYVSFTVDENATIQKDLLVAKTAGTKKGTNSILSFTFNHVCSALRFFVKKSTNLNSYTVNITSVRLCNVIKQGKYYFGTSSWNTTEYTSKRSNYTLYTGTAITLGSGSSDWKPLNGGTNDITGTNPYLFLIPQTLTAWNPTGALGGTYLEIVCTIKLGESTVYSGTAYIPFGTADGKPFLKGKKHEVKINIGKNSLYSGPGIKIIPAS